MNLTILCTFTTRCTLSFHAKKFYDLHREFRTPLCYLGCSHSHLMQTIFHMRERQIPEQISIRMKLQDQFLAFQSRRKSSCTPLILYWHSLKHCLPWVKNVVIPFWTVNLHKDFLRLIPIWLPVLYTFFSVKREYFCVFFLSKTELVI